jgi:hypothetical protein
MTTTELSGLIGAYLELKDEIEECQDKQAITRDRIKALIPPYADDVEVTTKTEAGSATWVKGRKGEKVDTDSLRQKLVLSGVPIHIVDEAFRSATTETVGQPTLRITGKR